MQKTVIFLMLLSYCVARSIHDGRDVIDTPMESIAAPSDIEVIEEVVEENSAPIEQQSDIEDEPVNADNSRKLFSTTTTAATAAPARPFTQTVDLLLVLNSSLMTARKGS
ncbi:uncharacterized protein LOC119079427 [Bradysia coprophila]|uniref:uncharacterized protein LOC119079427 n=1 Tax=Bradysia coprophila TaxID=38358 RepID=UPI00187D8BF8|nr:uncharacterized protein LOC119079427 [Bradysia coprophila]